MTVAVVVGLLISSQQDLLIVIGLLALVATGAITDTRLLLIIMARCVASGHEGLMTRVCLLCLQAKLVYQGQLELFLEGG